MKIFFAGSNPAIATAANALGAESVLEIDRAPEGEDRVLLLEWRGSEQEIEQYAAQGVRVVAITEKTAVAREAALRAGASEVVMPPVTPARLREAVDGTVGRGGRRHVRYPIELRAMLDQGGGPVDATVLDLSRRGARMHVATGVVPFELVRVAIRLPPPHTFPPQFARIVDAKLIGDQAAVAAWTAPKKDESTSSSSLPIVKGSIAVAPGEEGEVGMKTVVSSMMLPSEEPATLETVVPIARPARTVVSAVESDVRMRFLGMAAEEEMALLEFLRTLDAPKVEPGIALAAIVAMGIDQLREADPGAVAGMKSPVLSAAERAAVADSDAGRVTEIGVIAITRVRASLLATLLEKNPELGVALDPETVARLRAEAKIAEDLSRDRATRSMDSGDPAAVRDAKQLSADVLSARGRLERVLAPIVGEVPDAAAGSALEGAAAPVSWDRPVQEVIAAIPEAPPINRRLTRVVLLATANIASIVIAVAVFLTVRRPVEASHVHVPSPVRIVGKVRVKSIFHERGVEVAVVDGSWYDATDPERREAAKLLQPASKKQLLVVRDLRGIMVAYSTTAGRVLVKQNAQ